MSFKALRPNESSSEAEDNPSLDMSDMCRPNSSEISSGDDIGLDFVVEHQMMCRICLSIMICPLPCGHYLCLECFKKSIDLVNLLCPFCRLRIGCWVRKAKTDKELIDWTKWSQLIHCLISLKLFSNRNSIQQKFPELVALKMSNSEFCELLDEELFEYRAVPRIISSDGEIGKEFEEIREKESKRLLAEEMASQELIAQILAEDQSKEQMRRKVFEETVNDENIARSLQEMDNNVKSLRNRTYFSD